MFDHEKLQVYGKALDFATKAGTWTSTWDKKHALVDHLSRATESVLLNLAEAARQRGTSARLRTADYAIGSSLECAGCLDVARIKALLTHQECDQEKHLLCEITKMLIGLRKAWSQSIAREQPPVFPNQVREGRARAVVPARGFGRVSDGFGFHGVVRIPTGSKRTL
jgi:four helix bundle protein